MIILRQKTIIGLLNKLNDSWNDQLQLFADNGSLVLIDYLTGEILADFDNINCDGGDPDHMSIDGRLYIKK